MHSTRILKTTLACALTLGLTSLASTAFAQQSMSSGQMKMSPMQQKTMKMMKKMKYAPCYGVNAAFKNDCQSPGHSCAGQDPRARDPQAFVAMPSGLCTKIAGGSLTKG